MASNSVDDYGKTIKQGMIEYQSSGKNADDLSALALRLEEVFMQSIALKSAHEQAGTKNSKANVISTIYTELAELSSQLPEDALLAGLVTSWQARSRYSCDSPLNLEERAQVNANEVPLRSQSSASSSQPQLIVISEAGSSEAGSSEAGSPEAAAIPELVTSQSSYIPASWLHVTAISVVVWILIKLPQWDFPSGIASLGSGQYYVLVAPLLVVLGIVSYLLFSQKKPEKLTLLWLGGLIIYSIYLIVITFFEAFGSFHNNNDTVVMMWLHSPIVLISMLGAIMYSHASKSWQARVAYLQYLSEIGAFSILILFGGIILTAFTLMLFEMSNTRGIGEWYIKNMVPLGIVATPLVASHLYFTRFKERSRIASILLQVFSPLCAITFLIYLIHMLYTGTSPVENREALITTNGLLIVIWVISVYHIFARKASTDSRSKEVISSKAVSTQVTATSHFGLMDVLTTFMLFVVSLFNVVILYSMFSRFNAHGFTLNRFIVTGVNILIFTHLCQIGYQYFKLWRHPEKGDIALKKSIVNYLPIYAIWSLLVVIVVSIDTIRLSA